MSMHKSAKQLLARNLKYLMSEKEEWNSQSKIAKKAQKAGGKRVAQTSVSNMLNPNSRVSPNLESIEAVAAVFGLHAWQLLHPTLGDTSAAHEVVTRLATTTEKNQNLIYQILDMDAAPDYKVAKFIHPIRSTKSK